MDSVEALIQSARGLYVLLVSSGCRGGLKKRTVRTVTAQQQRCALQHLRRPWWELNFGPGSVDQYDRFDVLRLSARV